MDTYNLHSARTPHPGINRLAVERQRRLFSKMASDDAKQLIILDEACKIVKEQAFFMKREFDKNNLKQCLNYATEMLRELRTNLLTPRNYYELYMKVVDELSELEVYFQQLQRNGKSMVELYEQVQSCANIVPRLYLLCCVGGVYIQSMEAPAKDILKDMVEMIKGVQHPTRGLFLRHYLTTISKNKVPDIGTPYEGVGGNIQDACSFLLQNFAETNRLWVRLQFQGAKTDKKKREKDRMDLRVLVGTCLVRLSSLEGLGVAEYKETVLPKITEELIACKDTIAQSYLMDCIINVFPDDFHIATLEQFLQACLQLKERVQVRSIIETMMNRLASHHATTPLPEEIGAFKLMNASIATLIEERSNMSLTETLKLQSILCNFALQIYPTKIEYVTHCLTTCGVLIDKTDFKTSNSNGLDSRSTDETTLEIENLLSAPLRTLGLGVLDVPAYPQLMSYLPWGNWRQVSSTLLRSVLALNTPLSEYEQVEKLLGAITPLLRDPEGFVAPVDADGRELPAAPAFLEEQYLVARVINLIRNADTDQVLRMYVLARTHLTSGGARRIQHTCSPLVFGALSMTRRVVLREKEAESNADAAPQFSTRKVFTFVINILTAVAASNAELALRLFLQAAETADSVGLNAYAYEFLKEALLLYESDMSDSKVQVRVLTVMIGTLVSCRSFPVEDYVALTTKVTQYANKLLKKPDQIRMVTLCSHLFCSRIPSEDGSGTYTDATHVQECLHRSLKIASVCNPNLYVEILDRCVYHFDHDVPPITGKFLTTLIELIKDQLGTDAMGQSSSAVEQHYHNTIDYIKSRQELEETRERYEKIAV